MTPSAWMLVGLFACGENPPEMGSFLSPDGETIVRQAELPILARLPNEYRFHRAVLYLDGAPVEGTPVLIRRRWWTGKGTDLLASLSTAGLDPGWHTLGMSIETPRTGFFGDQEDRGTEWIEMETRFRFVPKTGRLNVRVVDQHGVPRVARIGVLDADGSLVTLGDGHEVLADPSEKDTPRQGFYTTVEGATEFLPEGDYELIASGGVRDGVTRQAVHVGDETSVELIVPRLIETPGEVTADLHVHTGLSADSFVGDSRRFLSLVAADVDVVAITDHNRIRDPTPALEMLNLDGSIETIPGVEFRFGSSGNSIGHGNAFPLKPGVRAIQPGAAPPAEVMANWRRHHADNPIAGSEAPALIQLNHPRGIQFKVDKPHRLDGHALFNELSYDARLSLAEHADIRLRAIDGASGATALDFDVLEVLNRFSVVGWRLVRADWFAMMNRGRFPTGSGNSDTHTVELERVGFPVNLVRVGESEGSLDVFVDAIRRGRVRVTTGPLVSLEVRTAEGRSEGPGGVLSTSDEEVEVVVRVDAAPWVPVPEVRLVVNGTVASKVALMPALAEPGAPIHRGTWTWRVRVKGDAWILAEAGWPLDDDTRPTGTDYAHVARGHVPIGFVNPVRVDDGDGVWASSKP